MYLKIKTDSGVINVNKEEVYILVEETIKMVPGVVRLGSRNIKDIFSLLVHGSTKNGLKIFVVDVEKVSIETRIQVKQGTNFSDVSKQVQKAIIYALKNKYNVQVKSVDVYIEGVI